MISFDAVEKSYGRLPGRREAALRGLDLRVGRGECVALVGPNGAGKSTVIGLVLGFLRPDAGRVRVAGSAPGRYVRTSGAGYLPERFSPPSRLRAVEVLRRLALLEGIPRRDAAVRARDALVRVGLDGLGARRVRGLSRGQRQRLAIAQLLLAPGEVLLLDEPFGGLDPEGRSTLRAILAGFRRDRPGAAVLVASHDLREVARAGDRAVVLRRGRAVDEVALGGDGAAARLERRVLAPRSAGAGGGGRRSPGAGVGRTGGRACGR